MFRDIFKSANDDIKADPTLLKKILLRADKNPKHIIYQYRFAAIAAVIALVIALPAIINPLGKDATLEQPLLPEAQNDKIYFYLSNDSTGSNSPVEDKKSSQNTIYMVINNISFASEESIIARAINADMSQTMEQVSADNYFDRLGFSPLNLELPDGLAPDFSGDTMVTVTKDGEEIISDENTFTFTGKNLLMVTTSSSTQSVMSYINNDNYEKSIIGDSDAVILFDGSAYHVYIIHKSGTALKIATDISGSELEALLISAVR